MRKNKAFSLIELLVVVSILGILAAVSVPAYISYKTKTSVAIAYNYLQSIAQDVATTYQKTGSFPSTVSLGATTVLSTGSSYPSTCSTLPVTSVPICQLSYVTNTTGSTTKVSVLFQATMDSSLSFGTANLLRVAVSIDKARGVVDYPCGLWNGASNGVPAAYQPSGCTCTNMQDYSSGGAATLCG